MILLLLFFYSAFFASFINMSAFVNVPVIVVILYIIVSFSNTIDYDNYHEESIEWVFSFIIISKLKYHHLLYLRNVHHKMHYFYKFGKVFAEFCVKEFNNTLKLLPVLIDKYLYIDLDYTYDGMSFLIEEYNEKYKHLVLNKLFINFIDL